MWGKQAQPFVNRFVATSLTSVGDGMLSLPPLAVWGNLAIYVAAWALLMWPQHLPLGRPCIAMVFAAMACGLRELCHAAWPEEDYPTVDIFGKINPTPIALLFGLMLVNAYLKDTGLWQRVEELLDSESPTKLLLKVSFMAASTSAVLTNDTTCLVLTPVVLNLCRRRGAKTSIPFLIAVATSSNIGSSLTIIGNPQNALIASISPGLTFLNFTEAMLLPVILGLAMNTCALCLYFRKDLLFTASEQVEEIDVELAAPQSKCLWRFYMVAVAVIVTAMVVGWVFNMATDDVALAAGSTLMLLRALRRRAAGDDLDTETKFALGAIDYSILILFIGQFILVGATVDTGLPQKMFNGILGPCAEDLAAGPGCLLWFAAVVLVLSNVISNVPVILMLQPLLATQPLSSVTGVWTVCAWVATVSGNLTMLGSAANLIVAHAAENEGERGLTATTYSKFSFLPTIVITLLGVLVMPPIGPNWSCLLGIAVLLAVGLLILAAYCYNACFRGASVQEETGMTWRNREAMGLFLVSIFVAGQPLGPYEGAWLTANPFRRYSPAELGELNAVQQVLVAVFQPLLGGFVDGTKWKRSLVVFASFCAAASAAIGVFMPQSFWLELAAEFPQAIAMTLAPLAINSLTLGVTESGFTQQVALNNVGTHVGTVICSASMAGLSLLGSRSSSSSAGSSSSSETTAPLWVSVPLAACVLAAVALPMIRYSKIDHRRAAGLEDSAAPSDFRAMPDTKLGYEVLFTRKAFLLAMVLSFLFNFANMAQLQLLVQEASALLPGQAISYTSAAQIVAHLGMLVSSVVVGRMADGGRKRLVLAACLTVTIRALLTAATDVWWIQRGGTPWLGLLPCEGLDGVCAGLWGALVVLLARDVSAGTGCFSLALGCMQAAFSAGAIASSTFAGYLANSVSFGAAFLMLAGAGCAATAVAAILPETLEEEKPRQNNCEVRGSCCTFVSRFWPRSASN
ncbi:LSI2 [Symbiodinium sp. CCMP2592]|nr:LSI2 [Symbiodinium sp. CCMP2592]